ncbi:hypothetical protein [Denitrobaculum tricleocarpae]|uniref:Uncharacterized protein n=1 Tax=Denitrobaculum tricleocarpae TaxID=2591009 RepID=A0A545TYS4_9PROT|nr:hypothetical protein [Denitrobaculum tricleocarpae]TQV82323.1 hypothetical protein FKG95_08905 [Denitrobaculum tricleocarpae]
MLINGETPRLKSKKFSGLRSRHKGWRLGFICLCLVVLSGCKTEEIALGVIGATVVGARTPTNEVEQTYYLGVFDEQEQLPTQVYRVRLRGQASAISFTKFASGWLPAEVVDTLGTTISFKKGENTVSVERNPDAQSGALPTGRKLILFGPEGFRKAPEGHRLVVVMGSSPETYFDAVNQSLGSIAAVTQNRAPAVTDSDLFQALVQLKDQRESLNAVTVPIQLELEKGQ